MRTSRRGHRAGTDGVVEGVREETGVDIPERDYPLLGTLASGAAYLAGRAGGDG